MTLHSIIDQFDLLMDAPDSVSRLRQFILQLAVQGKLTEQDPSDEPADQLLERIQAEKQRLYDAGEIRKPKDLPSITDETVPFELPDGWTWTRIAEICNLENGDRSKNYPKRSELVDSGIPFINAGHLQDGQVNFTDMNYVPEDRFELLRSGKVAEGDVLFCLRGSLGKCAIIDDIDRGAIASSLVIVRPLLEFASDYLLMYFGSALCEQMIDHYDNGTAQPNLGSSSLAEFLIPLPPLAEQQRIVATVDRLMDECDTLDAQQDAAERVRVRCTEAATHALQTADTPTAVRTAWHRLRDHFDALCATPDDVDAVRQTILQLAVQGKLTEQDPSDEPADQLLERIQAEKQRLYDAGEIRKPKDMPSPTEDELPFTVPENWQWIRVTELMYDWGSGLERAKKEQSKDRQFPYVKMDNIDTMGNLALDSYTYVDADSEEIEKYKLHRGDFLFNVRNSTELVGKSCVFNVDSQVSFLFNNNILRVDFGTQVLSDYINSWFCSGAGRRMLDELKSSTTNVAAIYHKDFFTCVVPLPPLEEQQRIVATVDRLMDACDTLEAQLSRQQTLGAELLDAVLHDASTTGPEAVLAEA